MRFVVVSADKNAPMPERFNASTALIDRHVELGDGNRVAIYAESATLTYNDTLAEIKRVAAGLRNQGIRPEERIGIVLTDSVFFVGAVLGAMRIGAIPVLVNPLLPVRDVALILADARVRLAILSSDRLGAPDVAALRAGAPEIETVVSTKDWEEAFPATFPPRDGVPYDTWDESPGFWLCTSGSTGQPKLVMHRHIDLLSPALGYAQDVLGINRDDICYSVGPAFHAYGLGNSIAFPFSVGAATVLVPTRPPTPTLVANVMAKYKPTLFFSIPTFTAALNASDLPEETFASVRLGISAAEALPAESYSRFLDRFGVQILDGIGSTELAHIYCSNRPGAEGTRPGTSGTPVLGHDLRLVDEAGAEVTEPDQPGQLLVSGPALATGYWCRTDQNRRSFDGAFLRTGDMYARSADGFYTYLGRADDMLRVGGEWVSPAEVEAVLMEHRSVLEAAIVGERDDAGVLRPVAFVITAANVVDHGATQVALQAHCRERLAGYKRPKRYEFVEALPKTATGKIQRFKLRAVEQPLDSAQ